jgi:hypothetical protein
MKGYGHRNWWHGSHGHSTRARVRRRPFPVTHPGVVPPKKVQYLPMPMTDQRREEIYLRDRRGFTPRRQKRMRQKQNKHAEDRRG